MSVTDLNRTMFFRTQFDVEDVNERDVLWKIVLHIRAWMRGEYLPLLIPPNIAT